MPGFLATRGNIHHAQSPAPGDPRAATDFRFPAGTAAFGARSTSAQVGATPRCPVARCLVMARCVISRRRNHSVAFGAKRTFGELRLQNRIYESAP